MSANSFILLKTIIVFSDRSLFFNFVSMILFIFFNIFIWSSVDRLFSIFQMKILKEFIIFKFVFSILLAAKIFDTFINMIDIIRIVDNIFFFMLIY